MLLFYYLLMDFVLNHSTYSNENNLYLIIFIDKDLMLSFLVIYFCIGLNVFMLLFSSLQTYLNETLPM